jgi:methionyl-tRNA formyltransferase
MKVIKKTNIIVSEKSWNQNLVKELTETYNSYNWICINQKQNFTTKFLKQFDIEKIFIPHWSYIINNEIYDSYECIVFHMTDLPFGRGGSPLQNLISRGIYHTKISALRVDTGIDSGDIYLKRDLDLNGSATEIFRRGNLIIMEMIISILENKIKPTAQIGKVTIFKRRKPHQSNIIELETLQKVYDYIRMLDADGYPKAYLENKFLKFEFNDANFNNKNEIIATVKIKMKSE